MFLRLIPPSPASFWSIRASRAVVTSNSDWRLGWIDFATPALGPENKQPDLVDGFALGDKNRPLGLREEKLKVMLVFQDILRLSGLPCFGEMRGIVNQY